MKFPNGSTQHLEVFEQYGTYQRCCRTNYERACNYKELLEICGLLEDDSHVSKKGRHRELHQSHIKKEPSCSFESSFYHPKLPKSMKSS